MPSSSKEKAIAVSPGAGGTEAGEAGKGAEEGDTTGKLIEEKR